MLYRIFTEDIEENHETLTEIITDFYEGFTILKGQGFWRLQQKIRL